MKRTLVILPILGLLACGHDSSRENPLDPELTPGVELLAASVDSLRGTVWLTWTAY